ncbi:MAG TPA: hypothetical protein ENH84_06010 [Phycisphaerae bacterium]|nr:hypothetical protein [Phycisphaerae bacterium]
MYPTKSAEKAVARFNTACLIVLFVILPTSKTLSAGTNLLDLPVSEKYRAEFPNGAKIELFAVSNNNWQLTWQRKNNIQPRNERRRSKPGYWWRPDGTQIPTEEVTFKRRRFSAGTGASQFDFLVRINDIDSTELTGMYKDNPCLHRVKVDSATDFHGNVLPNLFVVSVPGFPRHGLVEQAAIHFGIEVGRWRDATSWWVDWSKFTRDSGTLHSGVGALIEVPVQTHKGVEVDLVHVYVNTPIRLVALDHTDGLHVARMNDRGTGIGIARRLCTFENMKLEEIKGIIFQRRDHQWVEFPDVVLEPHHVRPFTSWGAVKNLIGKPAPEF